MVVSRRPNASSRSDASAGTDSTTSAGTETDSDTDAWTDTRTDARTDAGSAESGAYCPVCDVAYDSVSLHGTGLMVNLLDNERYRRVCFEPVSEDGPRIRFYHHTHEQTALSE